VFLGINRNILYFGADFEVIYKHYILRFFGENSRSQYLVVTNNFLSIKTHCPSIINLILRELSLSRKGIFLSKGMMPNENEN